MKPRERIVAALQCKQPDRVPIVEYLFSPRIQRELLGCTTSLYDGAVQVELADRLGMDGIWIPTNGFCGIEETPHGQREEYLDEWGVKYIKDGWPIMVQIESPVKSRDDWNRYRMPKSHTAYRTRMLEDAIKANTRDLAVIAGFVGPFTMMYWYLMDLEFLSITLYDDPELIQDMCVAYVDWALESAQIAYDLGGVDVFHISDDWGSSDRLLMSPQLLRQFFIPPFKRLVQGLKRFGVPVIMHNDGRLWEVLDDLVETGINAYHPVERAAGMDLGIVKQKYLGKLCPIGNVNNKTTMVTGSVQDVENEVKECISIASCGGGYILSTDHSLHDDVPLENVYALIESCKMYGCYNK